MALPSSLAYEKVFHEEGRFSEDIQNIIEFYQNRKEQIITFYIEKKKFVVERQHTFYNIEAIISFKYADKMKHWQ